MMIQEEPEVSMRPLSPPVVSSQFSAPGENLRGGLLLQAEQFSPLLPPVQSQSGPGRAEDVGGDPRGEIQLRLV